jgi:Asp-tRNA(Asn)/Glu-tRNA(Gln) amidotransferase A subunit family amidase
MSNQAGDELGALRLRVDIAPSGQGALSGLTFAVKDMFDVAGIVTGGGSPDWLASHGPAARTAPSAASLSRCAVSERAAQRWMRGGTSS